MMFGLFFGCGYWLVVDHDGRFVRWASQFTVPSYSEQDVFRDRMDGVSLILCLRDLLSP
jgi:hypothetical protein